MPFDIVYFVYGLSFVLLGTVLLVHPKEGSRFELARIIWLLGTFGLVHGVAEWIDLFQTVRAGHAALDIPQTLGLTVSYLFLFEFARRVLRICAESTPRWRVLVPLLSPWLYVPVMLALAMGVNAAWDPWRGLDVWSRYLLALPSTVLAAIGFVWYAHVERARLQRGMRAPFLWAAGALVAYGIAGGLIGAPTSFFPGSVINEQVLYAQTGVHVRLVRAAVAVALAVTVGTMLRIFAVEAREGLRTALDIVQRSLGEVRRLGHRNELILEAAGEGIMGIDRQGRVTFANTAAQLMLGYAPDELIGQPLHTLVHRDGQGAPTDPAKCRMCSNLCSQMTTHGTPGEVFTRQDGTSFPIEYTCAPMREDGEAIGAVLSFRDVTTRQAAERNLRLAAQVLQTTTKGVLVTDARGVIQSVNPAFLKATGYTEDEVLGKNPRMLKSGYQDGRYYEKIWKQIRKTGRWQGEIWNRRKTGEVFPEWLNISAIKDPDGHTTHYVGIYSDIQTRDQVQQRLHYLAYYDALTGLPNRQLFNDHLHLALVQARREGHMVGVMFLDLDRFKNINDTLGHSTGDRVLRAVAERLQECVREGDTIARLGGDEFTMVLPNIGNARSAATVAKKMLIGVQRPITVEGREYHITASIGIALYPRDGRDMDSLIKNADTALYRAKDTGRNNYQMYRPELSNRFRERVILEHELRRALDGEDLRLNYQPQVEILTGHLVGVEALARWCHPERGHISPSAFVPVAEDSGLIGPLGAWVLRTACTDARRWLDAGMDGFRVAVNLSGRQLEQPGLEHMVADILSETGLPAERLELELTETVLMSDREEARRTIHALNEMGVRLAIDDFGTGYSSLSYLRQFAIDKLKIDRSFVQEIPTNPNDAAIAATIISIAHTLDLRVIAEGVETAEQLNFLRAEGCDEIQGYLYSRPVPAEEISAMLHKHPMQLA